MRPRGYYVVFLAAFAIAICAGHAAARALSPQRAYVRFTTRLAAEEFAAWWQQEHPAAVLGTSTKE